MGTLHEAVEAAYEKATSESPPVTEPTPSRDIPSAESETPLDDSPATTSPPEDGRKRDDKGRFAPKALGLDGQTDSGAPLKEGKAGPEAPPAAPAASEPAKPDPLSGMGMTKGDMEMFHALPEQAQAFIKRRYSEMSKGLQDVLPLREYQPVAELFRPYENQLRVQGLSPATVIQRWAAAEQMLQQNPMQALTQLGRMYGVDLANLGANSPMGQQQAQPQADSQSWLSGDPAYQGLQQEVAALKQHIAQSQQSHTTNQIRQFAEMKDSTGKLAHPYFENVVDEMIALANASRSVGKTPDLEAIYGQAVWANPTVREELLAAQRDAAAKDREKQAREKAAAAARAGASVGSGAPLPGSGDSPAPKSLRKTVEEAWNRFGSN